MRVAIIDYDCGNVTSLKNALEHLGEEVVVTNHSEEIFSTKKILIPGVGAFGYAIQNINANQLKEKLNEAIFVRKIDTLGICLGAQIMLESSEESPNVPGLGWIQGTVARIVPGKPEDRIPHVGWNQTKFLKDSPLGNQGEQKIFYYTHSFCMNLNNKDEKLAQCSFGTGFTSVFRKGNLWGCQFHPEKSQKPGLEFLRHFLDM